MTTREIVAELAGQQFLNPSTDKPWSLRTIHNDIEYVRDEWRTEATDDIGKHIAAALAELREVRRVAWQSEDLSTVLKAIKQEAELLGLDAPKRVDIRQELRIAAEQFASEWGLDTDEVVAEAERILSEAK